MSTSIDDLLVELAIANANCKPSDKKFIEGCMAYYEKHGTLTEKQAKVFSAIYFRTRKALSRDKFAKRAKR